MHTFYPSRRLPGSVLLFLALAILSLSLPPTATCADPVPAAASAPRVLVLRLPVGGVPQTDVIPAGTTVALQLMQRLKSGEAKVGDRVTFEVAETVPLGQTVVIPVGTPVSGHVESSHGAAAFGRAGTLRLRCDYILLPSAVQIPVQRLIDFSGRSGMGTAEAAGIVTGLTAGGVAYGGSNFSRNLLSSSPDRTTPTMVGLATGVAVGALVGSLCRGGDITLERGQRLEVTLMQDTPVTAAITGTH